MVLVQKWDFFPPFYFWQNRQEKSLCRYFRKKKGLYSLQKQGVKKSKNCLFKKAFGHGFGPKMGFFQRFNRWQNREGKSLCRYSRKKKDLSRLYNQGVKKKKKRNWPFFQRGLVHDFAQKMTFFPRFYLWQSRHWNNKTPF